jgi:hypothetical protein
MRGERQVPVPEENPATAGLCVFGRQHVGLMGARKCASLQRRQGSCIREIYFLQGRHHGNRVRVSAVGCQYPDTGESFDLQPTVRYLLEHRLKNGKTDRSPESGIPEGLSRRQRQAFEATGRHEQPGPGRGRQTLSAGLPADALLEESRRPAVTRPSSARQAARAWPLHSQMPSRRLVSSPFVLVLLVVTASVHGRGRQL